MFMIEKKVPQGLGVFYPSVPVQVNYKLIARRLVGNGISWVAIRAVQQTKKSSEIPNSPRSLTSFISALTMEGIVVVLWGSVHVAHADTFTQAMVSCATGVEASWIVSLSSDMLVKLPTPQLKKILRQISQIGELVGLQMESVLDPGCLKARLDAFCTSAFVVFDFGHMDCSKYYVESVLGGWKHLTPYVIPTITPQIPGYDEQYFLERINALYVRANAPRSMLICDVAGVVHRRSFWLNVRRFLSDTYTQDERLAHVG